MKATAKPAKSDFVILFSSRRAGCRAGGRQAMTMRGGVRSAEAAAEAALSISAAAMRR